MQFLIKVATRFQTWRLRLAEKTLADVEFGWAFEQVHTSKARRRYERNKARLEVVIAKVRYNLGLQEGDES